MDTQGLQAHVADLRIIGVEWLFVRYLLEDDEVLLITRTVLGRMGYRIRRDRTDGLAKHQSYAQIP
jgi:hypothetical protein